MLRKLLKKDVNITTEKIDTHKCRFMGDVETYAINLVDKDFRYTKAILNKPYGGAMVLPIDKNGDVFLEVQYRFAIRQPLLELPAGRINEGETYLECATRELREETGCTSKEIINFSPILAQPDFTNEELGSFIALNCEKTEEQELDADEGVSVVKVPFELLVKLVIKNVIIDERTIILVGEARCIQGLRFETYDININDYIENIKKTINDEGMLLEEKEVDVDYTKVCEFGVIKDHIVKISQDKNSRRECFYVKAQDIVLPISKNGKIGVLVRYVLSVKKNLVQLPCKLEFDKDTKFTEFGEMVTAVGYSNDRQYMFLAEDLEETDDYIWLTVDEVLDYIKSGDIVDGRVLAIIFKYLLFVENCRTTEEK